LKLPRKANTAKAPVSYGSEKLCLRTAFAPG
jgi:hypothetical protein